LTTTFQPKTTVSAELPPVTLLRMRLGQA
jgi:hypothetical protein